MGWQLIINRGAIPLYITTLIWLADLQRVNVELPLSKHENYPRQILMRLCKRLSETGETLSKSAMACRKLTGRNILRGLRFSSCLSWVAGCLKSVYRTAQFNEVKCTHYWSRSINPLAQCLGEVHGAIWQSCRPGANAR